MDQLLAGLGKKPNALQRFRLVVIFFMMTACFIAAKHAVYFSFRVNPVGIHIFSWAAWFVWQGWLFPLHRERFLQADPVTAYRKAFCRDILPGATAGASQAFDPLVWGFIMGGQNAPSALQTLTGTLFLSLGVALAYLGFTTIGIAAAGFMFEYQRRPHPLVVGRIYSYVRHPICVGGIIASFGASLFPGNALSLTTGVLNLAILPLYGWLEDARLTHIYGDTYLRYKAAVRPFVPRLADLKTLFTKEFQNT